MKNGVFKTTYAALLLLFWTSLSTAQVEKMAVLSGTETTSSSDPTDLNQATPFAIKWSTSAFDSNYFDHSTSSFSNQLRITTPGDYRLFLNMPLVLQDGSSNRRSITTEVYLNGTPVDIGHFNSGYIRQASGHAESSVGGVILLNGLTINDKVEVFVSQGITTGKITTVGAQLVMEYIDPSDVIYSATATQTTNSTNLNQATEYALEWTHVIRDSGYTHSNSSSPENIGLDSAGNYWVFLNIPLNTTTCFSRRNSVRARVKINGTTVNGGNATQGYMRCLENHDSSSLHWVGMITGVTANDTLTVTVRNETNNTDPVTVTPSRKASIHLERVVTFDTISLSGTTVLAGNNWNEDAGSEVVWDVEHAKDATVFDHSTSTDARYIEVNEDGNYLVLFNSHLTSTARRPNSLMRIKVNSSVVQSGVCKTGYIRSQEGHNESSCSLSYLLAGLSSGDKISIETIKEALGATVNDASPATITIKKVSDAVPPSGGSIVDNVPDKVLHVDAQTLSSVLDESNRIASDLSFSGDVATWKDISQSPNIHDLTQNSASAYPTFNSVQKFISFDGVDDHFDVADSTDLNTATQLKERTIVTAFKTGPDVNKTQVIYEEGGTVRGMNVYIRNGNLYIGMWNVANDGDGSQPFAAASTPVAANTHYYTTLVLDYSNYTGGTGPDGILTGHINGTEFLISTSITSLLYNHPGDIGVGAMQNDSYFDTGPASGYNHFFEGDLFELIIYNHAIDSTEAIDFYDYLSERWPDPQPVTDLALSTPYTTSSSTTPSFSWTASISPDVVRYDVALGTTAGATDVSGWSSAGLATSTSITGLSLSECTNYFASVRAVDSVGDESTVETTSFLRYDNTDPTDPSGLSLSGGASSSTSKQLSWTNASDTCSFSHYEVAIGTTAGGTNTVGWTDIGNISTHQFTGLSLADATDYYTSIRAHDSAGNTSNVVTSASWQVDTCVASDTTDPTDPGTPSVSGSPSSTASPQHAWTAGSDACGFSHYEISIGTTAGGTNVSGWTNIGTVLTYKVSGISPTLSTNTDYYTNVRSVDLAGNTSAGVSTAAWQLPSPGGVSSGLTLWLDAADTGTLFSNAGCTTPVTDGGTIQCWQDKSTDLNHTSSSGGATPTWQDNEFNSQPVVRFDGSNDVVDFGSAISDIRSIFIVNKSDTTNHQLLLGHNTVQHFYTSSGVLVHPSISSTFLRTGSWRVDRNAVSSPTTFSQTGAYSLISMVSNGFVYADHIASDRKVSGRFFQGDVAEVIIYDRSLDSAEVTAVEDYLYNKWFSAAPAAVTELNLTNGFTNNANQTPSFSWTHSISPDTSYYEVALGTSPGSNDISGWTNIGLVNTYQFTGITLSSCIDYYASVRAVDTDGFTSSFASTAALKFDNTPPGVPTGLVLSETASATTSQRLTWSSSSDACSFSHYEVSVGTSAGSTDIVTWTDVGDTNSHKFSGITPDLAGSTDYFLNVRAVDSAGNGSAGAASSAWQLESCISSDVTPPTDPSNLNLVGSGTLTKTPQISWTGSTDACSFSHYEYAIGTTSGGTQVLGYTNIGDVSSYQRTGISPNLNFGTNYYISIRAHDQAGNTSSVLTTSAWQLATPGDVDPTGLSLWYDTNDFSTIYSDVSCVTPITGNNDAVACIADKSGNANRAWQSQSFRQPVYKATDFNGKPSLYFDGATDEFLGFNSAITDIRTVFWVIKEDASNPGDTAFLLGWPEGSTAYFHRDSTQGPIFHPTLSSAEVRNGTLQKNGSSINGTTTNMPSSEAVLSLTTTGNVTASALSKDRNSCCANRTWGGSVAELIIYDRVLSAGEIQDVEDELLLKWGITSQTTAWTGASNTNWFEAGNWSNGVPSATKDCVINDQANDPIVSGATATCRTVTIGSGIVTLANSTGAILEVYGDFTNNGTFTQNDGTLRFRDNGASSTNQIINTASSLGTVDFNKTAGGELSFQTASLTISDLTLPAGSNFTFKVEDGKTLTASNGATVSGGTLEVLGGGTLEIGDSQTLTISGGTLKTSGTNDAHPQSTSNKATITRAGTGRISIVATSGSVDLTGFLIDYLDVNGLQINGTANLLSLDGGQFTNLLADFATPVKAIQLNTSASISESLAQNVGFNWSAANSNHSGTPASSDSYYLVYAPNCGSAALVFDQWFGDFWAGLSVNTESKIHDQDDGGPTCQISMDISASPVNLIAFDANGYDKAVRLTWETSAETFHLGFNVYRSEDFYSDYTQINSELIRNFNNSTTFKGKYLFDDQALENGKVYYYMIEDVATDGQRELHGPVSAMPLAALGAAPANDDTVVNEAPTTPPSGIDLGDGAEIVSQIQGSFRLQVLPGDLTFEAAGTGYKRVFIPGYSRTVTPSHPELLYRKILIEVDREFETLDIVQVAVETEDKTADLGGDEVKPSANWTANSEGVLVAEYTEDSDAYSQNASLPVSHYTVNPDVVKLNNKNYVEVTVSPLRYNPASRSLTKLTKLVLDVGVQGNAWQVAAPPYLPLSPAAVSGGVRIRYKKPQMMEVSFEDLQSLNIEGPLAGVDVDSLRLYYHGTEHPLEIVSADGSFGPGDKFRFYAPYQFDVEDQFDEVVLTQFNFNDSDPALRYENFGNEFAQSPVASPQRRTEIIVEENTQALFDVPLGTMVDRFYWSRIFTLGGSAPDSNSRMDTTVNLPDFQENQSQWVFLKVDLRGRKVISQNPTHHVAVYINGSSQPDGSQVFQTDDPVTLEFALDPNLFVAGSNSIRLEVVGDKIPAGDYDLIDVNRIKIDYPASYRAFDGIALLEDTVPHQQMNVDGFSTENVHVYDISDPRDGFKYDFYVSNQLAADNWLLSFDLVEGFEGMGGRKVLLVEEGHFGTPDDILLTEGNGEYLIDSSGADLILIGRKELLDVSDEYIAHRESQGVSVLAVTPEQVFAEFSHGRRTSAAIRSLINYAKDSWESKPKYLLILGDASYDPSDILNANKTSLPIPIMGGQHIDFGSDNWFVQAEPGEDEEESFIPQLAIGRIPTSNSGALKGYFDKLIAYESGTRSPDDSQVKKATFVSGLDERNEDFDQETENLAQTLKATNSSYQSHHVHRKANDTDDSTKEKIHQAFDDGSFLMTYMGHGAENIWGSAGLFTNDDAKQLSNQTLPVVMALNCLNAYFYDPDTSSTSIGENLVLNPDGGAIAFWGSTAMTSPMTQTNLATALLNEVGQKSVVEKDGTRLGDLILIAKQSQANLEFNKDAVQSYTLIGDPSMTLPENFFAPASVSSTPPVQVIPSQPSDSGSAKEPEPIGSKDSSSNTVSAAPAQKSGGGCAAVASTDYNINTPGYILDLFEFPFLLLITWMVLGGLKALRPREE